MFNIGDRVRLLENHPIGNEYLVAGASGIVCYIDRYSVGVCWDYSIKSGHDCYGNCRYGYGWLVNADDIELDFAISIEPPSEMDFLEMIG